MVFGWFPPAIIPFGAISSPITPMMVSFWASPAIILY
jgi:hypothetical protein